MQSVVAAGPEAAVSLQHKGTPAAVSGGSGHTIAPASAGVAYPCIVGAQGGVQ